VKVGGRSVSVSVVAVAIGVVVVTGFMAGWSVVQRRRRMEVVPGLAVEGAGIPPQWVESEEHVREAKEKLASVVSKLMRREDLEEMETAEAIDALLLSPAQTNYQAAALLTLMAAKGETPAELAGMARAMRRRSTQVNPQVSEPLLDIVGTGGDGANTVNISTAAAILAAAAGARVAKHGNRSSTSMCGSADVLDALGVQIELSAHGVERCVEECGIGFMFAPAFHPAMKHIKEVRRGLKFRTAFNILGPLLNPALAQRQVIGVFSEDILDIMAETIYNLGTEKSWIVHSEGLDELSPLGPAEVREVTPQGIRAFRIDPLTYGIPRCTLEDLRGGDAEYNATALRNILGGHEDSIGNPVSNAVILNAAAGLFVADLAPSLSDAVELAKNTIRTGEALARLDQWAMFSSSIQ